MAHGLRHENINPLIGNCCLSSCLLSISHRYHSIRITHERTHLFYVSIYVRPTNGLCEYRLAGRSNSYGNGFWILFARFAPRCINYGRHKAWLVVSIKFVDRFSSRHALFALVHDARAWCIDIEKLCGRRQMGAESHRLWSESFLRSTRCTNTDENSKTYELWIFWFARAASRHPPFHRFISLTLQNNYGWLPNYCEMQKDPQNMAHNRPMCTHSVLLCKKLLFEVNRIVCYHCRPTKFYRK